MLAYALHFYWSAISSKSFSFAGLTINLGLHFWFYPRPVFLSISSEIPLARGRVLLPMLTLSLS